MSGFVKSAESPLLSLTDVSKNFGGVVAADKIRLEIRPGEVLGLIGPNGAGKTTLINLITGVYPVSSGSIVFRGGEITKKPVHARAALGIGRTFQHPHLLGRCDVGTNLVVGQDMAARKKLPADPQGAKQELGALLQCAGLEGIDLAAPVSKLSYGQQKLLEVVRVLLSRPYLILLDEPAAGLNNRECEYVAALIRYATQKGIGTLLIEHSMELVMSVCDRITVLNFGVQIATGTPAEIQANDLVIEAYLGGGSFDAED